MRKLNVQKFPVWKIAKWVGIVAVTFLVVPPIFAVVRGAWFVYSVDPRYARTQAATELYSAYQEHKERQLWTFNTGHPYSWPYLDCPPELQNTEVGDWSSEALRSNRWSPDIGSYILMAAFIAENEVRREHFNIVKLSETFSPIETVLLAACIDASVLAPFCSSHVSSSAWENSATDFDEFYSEYPVETDVMRAETNCRYYEAATSAFEVENTQ